MAAPPINFGLLTRLLTHDRQRGCCGMCGDRLGGVPNQSDEMAPVATCGGPAFDRCVMLCKECHFRIHTGGIHGSGIVASASHYPYFSGGN